MANQKTPASSEDPQDTIKDLQRQITSLRRKQRHQGTLEDLCSQAASEALSRHLASSRPKTRKKPRKRSGRTTAPLVRPLVILTDWQLGKVTRTYDMATCADRVSQAVQAATKWIEHYRGTWRIEGIDILFNGDMVEGETIFESQVWEIEAPVLDQALEASRLMASAVDELSALHDDVRVICVQGNHGRVGRKGGVEHPRTNWDRVAYEMASMRCESPWASWRIAEDTYEVFESVGGFRVCATHGDVSRGNPSVAWPRRIPKLRHVLEGFDLLVIGHNHHHLDMSVDLTRFLQVGSTESDSEYARDLLATESKPSQALVAIGERGIVGTHVLYLD